jgi:predicted nuclease of restriction endonuclease-like (RecB) superfamily
LRLWGLLFNKNFFFRYKTENGDVKHINMKNKTIMIAGDFSPEAYNSWAIGIFHTIESAKLQASLKLNADLLHLYHTIGKEILEKQEHHGWGAQVIDLLSSDLQKRYKGESGYSIRNLGYMKGFAKQYPDFPFLQVPLAKLEDPNNNSIWQASLAKLDEDEKFVQRPIAQIPWKSNITLMEKEY